VLPPLLVNPPEPSEVPPRSVSNALQGEPPQS
jgi:hypothetical protein